MQSNLNDHSTRNISSALTLDAAFDAHSLYEHTILAEKEFIAGRSTVDDSTEENVLTSKHRNYCDSIAFGRAGSDSAQPLDASVSYIVGDSYSSLLRLTQCRDTTEMRAALRSYINTLEEMYSQI